MSSLPLPKPINKRMLCTYCDFYSSSFIDSGYGCGYRNTQMILSSIRKDPQLFNIVFNNSKSFQNIGLSQMNLKHNSLTINR